MVVIPIPIPIGTRHSAIVRGSVWKFVACEQCQCGYAYLLELEATGDDLDLLFLDGEGSAIRARAKAEQNLEKRSHNCLLPVPCPACGFYQGDMATQLKEDAWINSFQVLGVVIVLLSLIPQALPIDYAVTLTICLMAAGLSLLAYGYVVSYRFDPNAGDPEQRKAMGRKHAIWGEQLDELRRAEASSDKSASADRPCD